jgi:hypothetical protein
VCREQFSTDTTVVLRISAAGCSIFFQNYKDRSQAPYLNHAGPDKGGAQKEIKEELTNERRWWWKEMWSMQNRSQYRTNPAYPLPPTSATTIS